METNNQYSFMNDHFMRLVRLILGAALVLAAVFYVSQYSRSIDRTFPARTFTVEGTGDVDSTPDIATFSATVTSEGGMDVAALQATNSDKMNKVTEFVKGQGVDAKDLKTLNYNLNPRYSYPVCKGGVCPQASINGYTITQTLQVKVRDTQKISGLLSGVVENGANSVSDVQFTLDDDAKAKNDARAEAIGKARQKAMDIAEAGGFRLGKLVTLYENSDVPQPMDGAYGMGGGSAQAMKSAVPAVQPGVQTSTVTVTLTYEIVN